MIILDMLECSIKIPCISRSFDIPLLVISDNKFNSSCPVIIGTNVIRLFRDSQLSSDFSNAWQSAIDSLQCVTFSAKLSGKKSRILTIYLYFSTIS